MRDHDALRPAGRAARVEKPRGGRRARPPSVAASGVVATSRRTRCRRARSRARAPRGQRRQRRGHCVVDERPARAAVVEDEGELLRMQLGVDRAPRRARPTSTRTASRCIRRRCATPSRRDRRAEPASRAARRQASPRATRACRSRGRSSCRARPPAVGPAPRGIARAAIGQVERGRARHAVSAGRGARRAGSRARRCGPGMPVTPPPGCAPAPHR